MMRLTTRGRRSGQPRVAIVGYYEDGPNLVTLAMNGWADAEPAWWLNLQAHPDATVDLAEARAPCEPAPRRARSASGCGPGSATTPAGVTTSMRSPRGERRETAVVVLEPRDHRSGHRLKPRPSRGARR